MIPDNAMYAWYSCTEMCCFLLANIYNDINIPVLHYFNFGDYISIALIPCAYIVPKLTT